MTGYALILADCPWRYGGTDQFQPEGEDKFRAVRMRYPTMTTADLCALDVASLAAPDCVLLFWATAPLLPDAFKVIAAWGFDYVTKMPWIKLAGDPVRNLWGDWEYKPQYGTGFWGRGCGEDVLICRRGNPKPPPAAAASVLLLSENFGHSRKPENLYEYAEYFPGPRLELFARRARPGWDLLGNGIDGRDIREILGAASAGATHGQAQLCHSDGPLLRGGRGDGDATLRGGEPLPADLRDGGTRARGCAAQPARADPPLGITAATDADGIDRGGG